MSMETQETTRGVKETARVETFSDGVFAIAITLLILNVIEVPHHPAPGETFTDTLLRHWPTFTAFVIGFISILVCWINHHFVFRYVVNQNGMLIVLNGLILLVVTIIPFPTAILADHFLDSELQTAITMYGINALLMSLGLKMFWSYASRKHFLDPHGDRKFFRSIGLVYSIGIVYTIFTTAISYLSHETAFALFALMFIIYAFPDAFSRRLMRFRQN
jgi:uncharacterized membrane protein